MTQPAQGPKESPPPERGSWKSLAAIVLIVVGGMQGWSWWQGERAAAVIKQHARAASDITLYTTSTCIYCAKAHAWLTQHDISWRECNVEQDAACMKTYDDHGAPGTPLVSVNGQWRLGFDPEWIGQVLAQAKPSASTSPLP